jgi:hypothetical protein
MQKTVKILAILLVAQLLLAAGIGFTDRGFTKGSEPKPLVNITQEKIDHITLEGPDDEQATLVKKQGAWVLPEVDDFPANSSRIEQLIERLGALRTGVPVATSRGAQERFKVSDDQYERRITLFQGDESLARIYLGSSPGMRLVHARDEESDAIYAVKMAAHDAPAKQADWEDKSILKLSTSDITTIKVNDLTFKRSAPEAGEQEPSPASDSPTTWKVEGVPDDKTIKPEAPEKLASLLADLSFERVLGQEGKPDYGLEKPVIEIELTQKEGETLTYRIGKIKDKEEYVLAVSNRAEYFQLANYTASSLIESGTLEEPSEKDANQAAEEAAIEPEGES